MDRILEIDLAFITCGSTGKLQTTYTVRQFKGVVIRWKKMLTPNKPMQLTWEQFLTHFKHKLCSAKDMLELADQILTLKKGSLTVDKYTNAFTKKNRVCFGCGV